MDNERISCTVAQDPPRRQRGYSLGQNVRSKIIKLADIFKSSKTRQKRSLIITPTGQSKALHDLKNKRKEELDVDQTCLTPETKEFIENNFLTVNKKHAESAPVFDVDVSTPTEPELNVSFKVEELEGEAKEAPVVVPCSHENKSQEREKNDYLIQMRYKLSNLQAGTGIENVRKRELKKLAKGQELSARLKDFDDL